MKIGLAQIRPVKGNIDANLEAHRRFITKASLHGSDLIVFPELSLTGYEPGLARVLAQEEDSSVLKTLQQLCNEHSITIIAGIPNTIGASVGIGAAILQPNTKLTVYNKRFLHEDEIPFFVAGKEPGYLRYGEDKIGLAICYEVFVKQHASEAIANGTTIYLASVAKTKNGMERAYKSLSELARSNSLTVLICNSVGEQDNFLAAGSSAAWNQHGTLIANLGENEESKLILDTSTNTASVIKINPV